MSDAEKYLRAFWEGTLVGPGFIEGNGIQSIMEQLEEKVISRMESAEHREISILFLQKSFEPLKYWLEGYYRSVRFTNPGGSAQLMLADFLTRTLRGELLSSGHETIGAAYERLEQDINEWTIAKQRLSALINRVSGGARING